MIDTIREEKLKFLFIVPVWGEHHRKLFTDICLPMLLTDGNFGHFDGRKDIQFCIVTTYEDYLKIRASRAARKLAKMIAIKYELINGLIDMSSPHQAMSDCYKRAMQSKKVIGGYTSFVFLSPDSFWSDGSFMEGEKLIDQGYKGIMVCGLRTDFSITKELKPKISSHKDGSIIDGRNLVSLSLQYLHQMAKAHNWLSPNFLNFWPSNLYWKDNNDWMSAHCFHLHPLFVKSPKMKRQFKSTIDDDIIKGFGYSVKDIYVVSHSDEMFGIEISPSDRGWGLPLAAPSLNSVYKFALNHANRSHWHNFKHKLIFQGAGHKSLDVAIANNQDEVVRKVLKMGKLAVFIHPFAGIAKKINSKIYTRLIKGGLRAGSNRLLRKIQRMI